MAKKGKKKQQTLRKTNFIVLMKATLKILEDKHGLELRSSGFDMDLERDFTELDLYFATRAIATMVNDQNKVCSDLFPHGSDMTISHSKCPPLKAQWLADFIEKLAEAKMDGLSVDEKQNTKMLKIMLPHQIRHALHIFVLTVFGMPPFRAEQQALDALQKEQMRRAIPKTN